MARGKKRVDHTGKKFGLWTALAFSRMRNGMTLWKCRCACGTVSVVNIGSLISGDSLSCGCYRRKISRSVRRTHGKSSTRVYRIWKAMLRRCNKSHSSRYQYYGGRGIRVCKRWHKFENFYADMGDPPSEKHSIDRIDNDSHYTFLNCRWATWCEQANNKRRNITRPPFS